MRIDLKAALKAVGVAVPIVFGLMLGRLLSPYLPQFSAWVHTLGMWAPFAYVAAYIVVVIMMLPAFLLIMVGGAVFGVVKGTALAMCGAITGGTCAFLIARYLARDFVQRRVSKNPTLATIDRAVGEKGMGIVFLLRLSPAIPFVLSNYALGVTQVRLFDFMIGTIGLIPIVLTFAAYGSASGAGPRPDGSSGVSNTVLVIGLIATAVLAVILTRIVQQALAQAARARIEAFTPVSSPNSQVG